MTPSQLALALFVAVQVTAHQEHIIGATYGLAACVGVRSTTDWADLEARGCNIQTIQTSKGPKNVTSARSTTQLLAGCPHLAGHEPHHADGMPVSFSAPVDLSTLNAKDFNISLSDGTWVHPLCVTAQPAGEKNEGQTIATIGRYGDGLKGTVNPVKIAIVGELLLKAYSGETINAQGLEFTDTTDMKYMNPDSAPRMVQAKLEKFSTKGETIVSVRKPDAFPNHCQHLYGNSVTHRVVVILSGGGTIDGITSFTPDTPDVFQALLKNGSKVGKPYMLGLADLGSKKSGDATYVHDNDNFVDICLADPHEEVVGSIARVRMPCTDTKMYYPKGNKHWSGCKFQEIDVIDLTKSVSSASIAFV